MFFESVSSRTLHALRPDSACHESDSTLSFILLQRMLQ